MNKDYKLEDWERRERELFQDFLNQGTALASKPDEENLTKCSRLLQKIEIKHADFEEVLKVCHKYGIKPEGMVFKRRSKEIEDMARYANEFGFELKASIILQNV